MKRRAIFNQKNLRALLSSGLSSLSNAGIVLVAASMLGPIEYGRFSLGVMLVLLASVSVNAFTGEVLLSLDPSTAVRGRAYAATWVLGLGASTVLGVALVVFGTGWQLAVVCVGAGVCVAMHAVARSAAFARVAPGRALQLDLIWVVVLAFGLVTVILVGPSASLTSSALAAIWAAGAFVAVLFSPDRKMMVSRHPLRETRLWLRSHGWFGLSLGYGVLTDAGARNVVVSAIAPAVGLVQLGGFRFAQSALGLSTIVFSAVRAQALAILSRAKRFRLVTILVGVSLGLSLVPLLAALLLLAIFPLLESLVATHILDIAKGLVWPIALLNVGSALSQGAQIGLRLKADFKAIMLARSVSGFALLVLGFSLLQAFGVLGAAWGMAIGRVVGVVAWWACLIVRVRSSPVDSCSD